MWPRGSGRAPYASVQEQLPLEAIEGDVLLLGSGDARAVLEAGSLHFALRSEPEQEAILHGYRRFLNALDYPLQVLVRVAPADIERYLAGIAGAPAGGEAMRRLARDHRAFVRRIARERTLLDRRFFVVVPAEREGGLLASSAWPGLARRSGRAPAPRRDPDRIRRTLAFRCGEVMRGLGAVGVETRRLGGEELGARWRETLAAGAGGHAAPEPSPAVTVSGAGREASRA
ncbi:MAG: hypothetical protein OXC94_03990 [Chloroflexi bacterium]|nr:hypothetical protein [Chloroflexota bacterium]